MLFRQTVLYLPAQVLAPAVQFATILVWAHMLPTDQVGIATLVVSLQELSFNLSYMWWSHFALRHLGRFRAQGSESFLSTESWALIAGAGLQAVVICPVAILMLGSASTVALTATIAAYTVTRSLTNYSAERARAEGKIALYTLVQIGAPLFGVLAGMVCAHFIAPTAQVMLSGFVAAQAVICLVAVGLSDVARRFGRPDRDVLKMAAAFGVPVMMAALLTALALNAPRFIVNATLGLAATGVFAVSYGLGMRAASFAAMLVTAGAYPLLVRKMETEGLEAAYRQLQANMMLVVMAVVPVCLGLLAVNRSVVDILIPEAYHASAYLLLPVATIGGVLRQIRAHTTDQVFLIRSRTGYSTLISATDLALTLVFSIVGALKWGLVGAAIGPLASAVCTLIASNLIVRFQFDFRLPIGALVRILIAGLIMMAVTMSLPDTRQIIVLALEVAGGAAVYAIVLAVLFPGHLAKPLGIARSALSRLGLGAR